MKKVIAAALLLASVGGCTDFGDAWSRYAGDHADGGTVGCRAPEIAWKCSSIYQGATQLPRYVCAESARDRCDSVGRFTEGADTRMCARWPGLCPPGIIISCVPYYSDPRIIEAGTGGEGTGGEGTGEAPAADTGSCTPPTDAGVPDMPACYQPNDICDDYAVPSQCCSGICTLSACE